MKYSLFYLMDYYQGRAESVYDTLFTQAQQADKLGYHGIYLAEHHVSNYGICPNPAVVLANIAAKTQYLHLGSAVTVLPLHSPLRVVEEFHCLNLLAKGRAELGLGSGYCADEFSAFGRDFAGKREQFDAAFTAIEQLLQQQTIHLDAQQFHTGDGVRMNFMAPDPLTIHLAGMSPEAAYHIGKRGYNLMAVPFNRFTTEPDFDKQIITRYREGLGKQKGEIALTYFCHVAETDTQAKTNVAAAFARYINARSDQQHEGNELYEQWFAKGFLLAGSVETVTQKCLQLQQLGVDHIICMQQFGDASSEVVSQSIELFANAVMPQLI